MVRTPFWERGDKRENPSDSRRHLKPRRDNQRGEEAGVEKKDLPTSTPSAPEVKVEVRGKGKFFSK